MLQNFELILGTHPQYADILCKDYPTFLPTFFSCQDELEGIKCEETPGISLESHL